MCISQLILWTCRILMSWISHLHVAQFVNKKKHWSYNCIIKARIDLHKTCTFRNKLGFFLFKFIHKTVIKWQTWTGCTSFDLWFPTFADLRYWWVNQASERSSQEENVGRDTRWDSWISHLQNNCSKAKSAVWSHRGRREWVIFQLFCYWSPVQLFFKWL